jgi:hypothetical protein
MTKDEIRNAYFGSIEPRVQDAERLAGDPDLDLLNEMATKESQFAYTLFHAFVGDLRDAFDEVVRLCREMRHCWLDDGSMSFVHARCRQVMLNDDYVHHFDNFFVVRGYKNELWYQDVEKLAIRHASEKARMDKYTAVCFDQECFRFLHGLLPAVQRQHQASDANDDELYDKLGGILNDRMAQYVKEHEPHCDFRMEKDTP